MSGGQAYPVWLQQAIYSPTHRSPYPVPHWLSTVGVSLSQSCLTLCDPMHSTIHGILQTRILEWVAFPFSRGSSQPRDRTQVSCIAGGFFTNWVTGKPKNTGVGSLSLIQGIFPTRELNQGSPVLQADSLPTELSGKPHNLPIHGLSFIISL